MNIYIYCVCAQLQEDSKAFSFKIVNEDGLDNLTASVLGTELYPLRIVFTLGPFLDLDEANNIESEAQSLLAHYRDKADWLEINPLNLSDFLAWIDSQILPIRVYEKRRGRGRSQTSVRKRGRKVVSAGQRAAARLRSSKSSSSQS